MIKIPFYDFKKENIDIGFKYPVDVKLQLPDGDYLRAKQPYGTWQSLQKINRETGAVSNIYTHSSNIQFVPLEVLNDGNVLVLGFDYPHHNYRILRSTDETLTSFEEVLFLGHMKPYSKHGVAQGEDGNILMGEYIGSYAWNEPDAPDKCNVWISRDNGWTWQVLYSFKRRTHPDSDSDELMGNGIQHIHIVEYDPFTKSYWIGTGDKDRESSLWRWNEQEGFVLIGRGYADGFEIDDGQYWRVLALEFFEDCVLWGIDSFIDGGTWIMRYDRNSKKLEVMNDETLGTAGYYSGTLNLPGGNQVSFFSGETGRIFYSYDQKKAELLTEVSMTTNVATRPLYTEDVIDKRMLFTGYDGNLEIDGRSLGTGYIDFKPREFKINFLNS